MANTAEPRPYFSVIVPTYNRAALVGRAVRSVLEQTDGEWELIVVDDGSTDGTESLVKAFTDPRITYLAQPNRERGAARNHGVAHARGRYVTFLDSDDYLYAECLTRARETLAGRDIPFLHVAYETVDPEGRRLEAFDSLTAHDHRALIGGNPFSCSGWFLRHDVARAHPFVEDREISGSEDWELLMRIVARHGFAVDRRVSAAVVRHEGSSVLNFDEDALRARKLGAIEYAFRDDEVRRRYGGEERTIRAYALSYVSLHLALAGRRRAAWRHYREAVASHLPLLFSRRSLVILKKLLGG